MQKLPIREQKLIRLLSGKVSRTGFDFQHDYGNVVIPWENITHVFGVRLKKREKIPCLLFFVQGIESLYYIEADSFNYKLFLNEGLTHKREVNFLLLVRKIIAFSPAAYIDWPLRDSLKGGVSLLPEFTDFGKLMEFCNEKRVSERKLETKEAPLEDSLIVIYRRKLEDFTSRRKEALRHFSRAYSFQARSPDPMQKVSVEERIQKNKKAINELERSIQIDPYLMPSYISLGETYQELNENEKAIEYFLKALQTNPSLEMNKEIAYVVLVKGLAVLYARVNDEKAKIWALNKYLGLFFGGREDDQCATLLSEKASISSDWYNIYLESLAKLESKNFVIALELINKTIEMYPSFRWNYHWRGMILKAMERYKEALESLEIANSYYYDAITDIEIAILYQEMNKIDEALELFEKIAEILPDYYLPYVYLAKLMIYQKKSVKESFKYILKAIELFPIGDFTKEMEDIVLLISEEQKQKKGRVIEARKEWKEGDVIDRRYKVQKIIKGGMGIVYIVLDMQQSKLYALKSFQDQYLWDQDIIQMFVREAEIWVKLGKHKNIVQAEQIKNYEGKPYIFLEYVDGAELETLISERSLKISDAVDFAIQFCEGMNYAFKKFGIVHQDIKPSNCLISKEGILKISDFGLVKIFSGEETEVQWKGELSQHSRGFAAGTFPYMSPEQILGKRDNINTTSDIYCFGAMFYEMLIGLPPFGKDNIEECIYGHLYEQPSDPCTKRDDVNRELGDIILKCLKKEQSERFRDFKEILYALRGFYEKYFGLGFKASTPTLDVSVEEILNRGESLMALERYREALSHFDEALKMNPTAVRVLIDRGECLYKLSQFDAAIRCLERAQELDPQNSMVWYHKGNVLTLIRKYHEALQSYHWALEIDPQFAESWSKMATVFDLMGQSREALKYYDRSININPGLSETWNNKGNLLSKLDRVQEAIECYSKAIEVNPRYLKAWYNKGILHQKLNEYKEANECFRRVIEIDPRFTNALVGSGISYFKLGEMEKALECYDKALNLELHNFQLWFFKGNCLYEMGRLEEASICFGKSLQISDSNIQAWMSYGLIMGELYYLEQAISCYNRALELNPNNEFVIKAIHRLKRKEENVSFQLKAIEGSSENEIFGGKELEVGFESYEKAIQHHNCLLELFPNDPKIWYRKGILLSIMGQDSEAVSCFERSFRINPDYRTPKLKDERAKYSLIKTEKGGKMGIFDKLVGREKFSPSERLEEGIRFFEKGELRHALKCFEDVLKSRPEMMEGWRYKCATLAQLKFLHEAFDCITKGLAYFPLASEFWSKKGEILEKMGRISDAIEAYEIAIKIFPWDIKHWMVMIRCLEKVSQHSLAKDYAWRALHYLEEEYRKGLRDPVLFEYKGVLSVVLERYVEANVYFDKLLQIESDNHKVLNHKGNSLFRLGLWSEALEYLEKAEKLSPYNTDILFRISLCLMELGHLSDALQTLNKVLELDPDFDFAWYYKGIIYTEMGDREGGIYFFTEGLQDKPQSPFLFGARGIFLYQQGKERDALWCFDKALELNPMDINYWLNKGIILNKINKPDEAVYCFDRILEMDSDDHRVWYFKALSHFLMKSWHKTVECCNKVLEINPRIVDALLLKGASLYRSQKFIDALLCFDRAVELEPERAETWNNRGVILRGMDKLEEALQCYNKALEVEPRFAMVWVNKGRWLSELNRFDEALAAYERALEIVSENSQIWLDMGHCHYELLRFGEALRCYDMSIKMDPVSWESWNSRGLALDKMGRIEESISSFEKAVDLEPKQCEIWNNLGLSLMKLNRKEEALVAFTKAISIDREYEEALYNRAIILLRLYCKQEAEQEYNKLLEINPDFNRPLSVNEDLLSRPVKRNFKIHFMMEFGQEFELYHKKPPNIGKMEN